MNLIDGWCYYKGDTYKGRKIPRKFLFYAKGETKQKFDYVRYQMWYWGKLTDEARKKYKALEKRRLKWVHKDIRITEQYGDF